MLIVLVPGLVFEAAYRLDIAELRQTFVGAAILAVPGVLVSAGVVALVLTATGLQPSLAFIVGAIVSATDPVSVIATFRTPGGAGAAGDARRGREPVQRRHRPSSSSSSRCAPRPGRWSRSTRSIGFVTTVAVSAVLGLVIGVVATRVMAYAQDRLIELTISVVLAYGTYLIADRLGQSGIIATVVAGIVLGTYGRRIGLPVATFAALDQTWEFIAFLLTAFVFLLIGLAITLGTLLDSAGAIALGVVGILVGRAIVVYVILGGASQVVRATGRGPAVPTAWLHVLFWAGLRGAIAMGLALSLPENLPERGHLQGIVFGITLFTLLVQGATTDLLLRRLGVRHEGPAEA